VGGVADDWTQQNKQNHWQGTQISTMTKIFAKVRRVLKKNRKMYTEENPISNLEPQNLVHFQVTKLNNFI